MVPSMVPNMVPNLIYSIVRQRPKQEIAGQDWGSRWPSKPKASQSNRANRANRASNISRLCLRTHPEGLARSSLRECNMNLKQKLVRPTMCMHDYACGRDKGNIVKTTRQEIFYFIYTFKHCPRLDNTLPCVAMCCHVLLLLRLCSALCHSELTAILCTHWTAESCAAEGSPCATSGPRAPTGATGATEVTSCRVLPCLSLIFLHVTSRLTTILAGFLRCARAGGFFLASCLSSARGCTRLLWIRIQPKLHLSLSSFQQFLGSPRIF